jgi:hypothetical protein
LPVSLNPVREGEGDVRPDLAGFQVVPMPRARHFPTQLPVECGLVRLGCGRRAKQPAKCGSRRASSSSAAVSWRSGTRFRPSGPRRRGSRRGSPSAPPAFAQEIPERLRHCPSGRPSECGPAPAARAADLDGGTGRGRGSRRGGTHSDHRWPQTSRRSSFSTCSRAPFGAGYPSGDADLPASRTPST